MSQPIQLLKLKTDETLETLAEHNHDNLYSKLDHNHTGTYAPVSHTHEDYATKDYTDATYSTKDHTHDSTYASITHDHNNTYATKDHTHTEYATTDHTHDEYSLKTHNHTGTYATSDHTHDNYASTDHNHDDTYSTLTHKHDEDYASKTHTHTNYATTDHTHDDSYSKLGHKHDDDYASKTHTHDDIYSKLNHNHDSKYPAAEFGVLFKPQLGEPVLDSQTFSLEAGSIPPTTITLPAYSGITAYTLLTSQDIEAYKKKYAINTETLKLKPVSFGLSHLHMTVSFSQADLAPDNDCCLKIYSTDASMSKTETAYATGFLLHEAEPFGVTITYHKDDTTNYSGLEIDVELPAATHSITAGEDYIIDTLLPTPPSGWLESVDTSLPPSMTNGVSHQGHQLTNPVSHTEDGSITLSYQGQYISWDTDPNTDGSSIKVK